MEPIIPYGQLESRPNFENSGTPLTRRRRARVRRTAPNNAKRGGLVQAAEQAGRDSITNERAGRSAPSHPSKQRNLPGAHYWLLEVRPELKFPGGFVEFWSGRSLL
jgi:hypothetical protein